MVVSNLKYSCTCDLCMSYLIMTAMKKRGKFVNDRQSTSIFLFLICKINVKLGPTHDPTLPPGTMI